MTDGPTICLVCAWRVECQKRFRYESLGGPACPDFCRDVRIKSDQEDDTKEDDT